MIKVQPSYSDIVWSQSADRITLTKPRAGIVSRAGLVILAALLWIGVSGAGLGISLLAGKGEFAIAAGLASVPGIVALLGALSHGLRSWSLERDGAWLTYQRSGLLGTRQQRWPAGDVASLYVREAAVGTEIEEDVLRVGFRNGRNEDIVRSRSGEELRWVAAMLMDPRGERKTSSPLILAAEPERRKVDPEIVPKTLAARTFEGGIELTFLPLVRAKGMGWRLPLAVLLGTAGIVGASVLLYHATHGAFPPAVPRILVALLLGATAWRLWVLQRWAVLQIVDGIVTVKQNQGREPVEFGVSEVEFVQTYRQGRRTELQFLLKNKPKVRLLEGREAQELEWAARFLRVSIKGRTAVPENAAMKVDPSAGDCPVCLEKMDSRVVYCATCRTPSHEECWSYMGMCSTYGCREIRFLRS
jgi:hypothetical protein